jgi:hypothetical protein
VLSDVPVFIEFNINNGFFVADHSIEEVLAVRAVRTFPLFLAAAAASVLHAVCCFV